MTDHWSADQVRAADEALLGCSGNEVVQRLPVNICESLDDWVQRTPDAMALKTNAASITYAALGLDVDRIADWLHESGGVSAGDRVVLLADNSPFLVASFFAIARLDAVAVVVNPRLTDREVALIVGDAKPKLMLADKTSAEAVAHVDGESVVQGDLSFECQRLANEDSATPPGVVAMIYTTGTTGQPKGVMLTHRNLGFVAHVSGVLRGIEPGDLVYCVLPMSHVFGLSAVCCSVLMRGGSLRLLARFDAGLVMEHLAAEPVAGFLGVPTMYALMLETPRAKGFSSDTLRFLFSGGAPLDPDLKSRIQHVFGQPLHNGFGLTETGPTICQTRLYAPLSSCAVGFPLPGVDIEIRDDEDRAVPDGEIGELWVRGPNVMAGYFGQDNLTATVIRDGWFCTGDLVRIGDDGAINIAGRRKELIIHSGFNVYPPEVEAVLNAHPAVALSAVVGRAEEGNETVVAWVQPVAGESLTADALLAFARPQLAGYKVPGEVNIVTALPTASSGKVLKHRLGEGA